MPRHSLGYQGRNCFVLFLTWLTQMVRHSPWTVSSNLLLIFIFLTWKSLAPHEFMCREGLQAAMQMALKQSKPFLSKLHLLLQCYIFFAVSTRDWFDLTYDLQSSQNCLFSVLRFPFGVTVWSYLYTGVSKGRGQKGTAGRMEERKVTPACGQSTDCRQQQNSQTFLSLVGTTHMAEGESWCCWTLD